VKRPYRIVTRSRQGRRRVFWALDVEIRDGWVVARGGFAGDGRHPSRVSLPLWTVEYIEESGRPPVKRGWVRPRVEESSTGSSEASDR
jgi:hypothetical protein